MRMRVGLVVVSALVLLFTFFYFRATQLSPDAPLSRMYRTESDIASLVKAVEHYRDREGVLPPPGETGLVAAVEALSSKVNFFPDGPPRDGWGQEFGYALGERGYAVYSLGADGEAGTRDDISTDPTRPWRATYRQLQQDYETDDAH